MTAASPPPPDKKSADRSAPVVVWLVASILVGVALGYFQPWRGDAGARRPPPRGPDPRSLLPALAAAKTRTQAYLELLDAGDRAVPALLEAAQDQGFAARGEAVDLLGRIGDRRALPVILGLTDPTLAHDRLVALGRLRGPEALTELRRALRSPRRELAFPALHALIDWPDLPAPVTSEVQPFLSDREPGLRAFAARFMGAHHVRAAEEALLVLLRDDDGNVRQGAAWALLRLGDRASVAAVRSAVAAGAVVSGE